MAIGLKANSMALLQQKFSATERLKNTAESLEWESSTAVASFRGLMASPMRDNGKMVCFTATESTRLLMARLSVTYL